jgi:hypothetical protein
LVKDLGPRESTQASKHGLQNGDPRLNLAAVDRTMLSREGYFLKINPQFMLGKVLQEGLQVAQQTYAG